MSMRRFQWLIACTCGSLVGAIAGLTAGMALDSALVAWLSAAAGPVIALYFAGLHQRVQLLKIACYALIGWGLCFVLEPATSQTAARRASRIAESALLGKDWYIPCHIAAWIFASAGVVFVTDCKQLKKRTNRAD
jgi:hypothetical protein